MANIDFSSSDEALIVAELAKRIKVKNSKVYFDKKQVTITLPGKPGKDGVTPVKGKDYKDGADGKTPRKGKDYRDGKDGITPVKGKDYDDGKDGYSPVKGKDYHDGKNGGPPAHKWNGTCLSFQNPDGSWGDEVDLKGIPGKEIKGDKGSMPKHEWKGSLLRIENPDGSFSRWVDLKGEIGRGKRGIRGVTPVKGVDYHDGKPGKDAVLPKAKTRTVLEDVDLVFIGPAMKPALQKKFQPIKVIEGK